MPGMNRRGAFKVAGLAATAWAAAACTGSPRPLLTTPPGTPAPTSAPPPSTSTAPRPPDWNALRDKLNGAVSLPNDRGFAAAHRLYNPAFDANTPAAVARPTTAEHVQACVETASAARIPLAARSGGHSYAGYSAPQDGLVVDLRAMNAVQVNADGTATVQAGARLIEVYTALAAQGRALPGGTCPSVGIAGLTLGGGIGVLTRKFGLTCDRLVSAKLVTADGTLRAVSAQSEPDLYWALRGGGGGNFGIVTEFTFSTEPAPQLTTFNLPFGAGTAPQVLGAWQEWVAGAPAELWSAVTLSARQTSVLSGCFVGTENGLTQQLAPLLRAIGANPTRRVVQTRDYLGAMKYYAGCSGCDPDSVARQSFTASSRVLGAPVRDTGAFAALLDGTSEMDVLIDSLGGAVAAVAPADSAFPHRQALATVQIYQKGNNPQAVAKVRDGMAGLGVGGGYVNYIDPDMPDWAGAYYGANQARLAETAARYDPDAVFGFAQAVRA